MTTRNGTAARIVAFVAAHPGCTRADLMQACGITGCGSHISNCCAVGNIHRAGPRNDARYYPTAAEAAAAHPALVAERKRKNHARELGYWRRYATKKRVERLAAGVKPVATRPGKMLFTPPAGAALAPDVRITIAPPMRDRWAA